MKRLVLLSLSLCLTFIYLLKVIQHQKIGAYWGPFPVMMVALGVTVVAAVIFLVFVPWFLGNDETAPWKMVILITATLLICVYGGVFMTEPIEQGASVSAAGQQIPPPGVSQHQWEYSRSRAGGSLYYFFYTSPTVSSSTPSTGGSVSSLKMPSCSGKACSGLAMVFLVICAILGIIGSFTVPHFWVIPGLTFVIYMWMVTTREYFFVNEYAKPKNEWRYEV